MLNEAYEALGNYYLTAIMPTQVRKPKQKASVEGAVGKIATAVIARLRNEEFHSMDELRGAVAKALKDYNHTPFQKREGSRYEVFQQEEAAFLRLLPAIPYEIATWKYHRAVYLDCHVMLNKNHYSCPYQYVGKKVDLRITDSLVEIYHKEVIDRIFAGVRIKEQGYNSCLAVLRLSKKYTPSRLDAACALALTRFHSPRYRHLAAILSAEEDISFQQQRAQEQRELEQAE